MANLPIHPVQYYWIKNTHSQKYLKSPNAPDGPQLVQGTLDPEALSMQWGFVHVGNGQYQIFNAQTGLCVTLAGNPGNGNAIQQSQWVPNATGQQWVVTTTTVGTGNFSAMFQCPTNTDYVWDGLSDSTTTNAVILSQKVLSSQTSQQWVVIPVAEATSTLTDTTTVYLNYLGWSYSTDGVSWKAVAGDLLTDSNLSRGTSITVQVTNSSPGPAKIVIWKDGAHSMSDGSIVAAMASHSFYFTSPDEGEVSWGIWADPTFKIKTTSRGR